MEDYEHKEIGYVAGFFIGLTLCWHTTFWCAGLIGYGPELEALVDSATAWNGWLKALLYLALIVTGGIIDVAVFVIASCAIYCIWKGIVNLSMWLWGIIVEFAKALANALQWIVEGSLNVTLTISGAIWDFVTWPFRFVFEIIADLYSRFAEITTRRREERQKLKRLYRERFCQDFRSYRAFMKYWKALQRGEDPPYPGGDDDDDQDDHDDTHRQQKEKREQKQQQPPPHEEREKRDPYQAALTIFGLKEPFTKAELKARYRVAMKKAHPDMTGGDDRAAQRLNIARDLIMKRKGWT